MGLTSPEGSDLGAIPIRHSTFDIRHSHPPAFTLIEVLVVISIVVLLVAILLPALAGARQTARSAICLANEQQLMLAVSTYAHDYNGRIPYGPRPDPASPANFYPVEGMVTSLISRASPASGGAGPVGAGLLLQHYLSRSPQVLFCPGADDPIDAQAELDLVGSDWAVSNYYYRHGSSTQALRNADKHIRLDDLGLNTKSKPIRVLFLDQNFHAQGGSLYKVLKPRTNHRERFVNAAYADGHAETIPNELLASGQRRFSIDVGFFVANADSFILATLERADAE